MKWFGGRESDDVEQGSSGGRGMLLGGGIIGLIGFIIYLVTGINPSQLLNHGGSGGPADQTTTQSVNGVESQAKQFSRVVFEGTTQVWDSLFNVMGKTYVHPILHFFSGQMQVADLLQRQRAHFIVRRMGVFISTFPFLMSYVIVSEHRAKLPRLT